MNYGQSKANKTRLFRIYSAIIGIFFFTVRASDILDLEEDNKLLSSHSQNSTYNIKEKDDDSCCLSWFLSTVTFLFYPESRFGETKSPSQNFHFIMTDSYILAIAMSFLNYPDLLKLSHVNKNFRNEIKEEFWQRKIVEQNYLIWDHSLPKAKIFFANYFYQKGFGRDPKLPEKIVIRKEDIIFVPNFLMAEKSLMLGFPKGKVTFKQAEHKKYTQSLNSSYQLLSTKDDSLRTWSAPKN